MNVEELVKSLVTRMETEGLKVLELDAATRSALSSQRRQVKRLLPRGYNLTCSCRGQMKLQRA